MSPGLASPAAPSARWGRCTAWPYSFGWDGSEAVPPGSSLVEIDLIDQHPDGTLLCLTHTGLPNAEQCAGHAEGWAHYLGRLAEVAAGRDPGPDRHHGRTGRE